MATKNTGLMDIGVLMFTNQIKAKEIADKLQVTPAAVSQVVARVAKSYKIQKEIARRLRLDYEFLWGEKEDQC